MSELEPLRLSVIFPPFQEKNQPLGLSLGGGRGWPLGSIPLFISSLTKGGVAARAGVLKVSHCFPSAYYIFSFRNPIES